MSKVKRIKGQFRQGDVLIMQINGEEPKAGAEIPHDAGRVVLAYGEVTGHAHAICEPTAKQMRIDGSTDTLLRLLKGREPGGKVALKHEEHSAIKMKSKTSYTVRHQAEYHPEAVKPVVD